MRLDIHTSHERGCETMEEKVTWQKQTRAVMAPSASCSSRTDLTGVQLSKRHPLKCLGWSLNSFNDQNFFPPDPGHYSSCVLKHLSCGWSLVPPNKVCLQKKIEGWSWVLPTHQQMSALGVIRCCVTVCRNFVAGTLPCQVDNKNEGRRMDN